MSHTRIDSLSEFAVSQIIMAHTEIVGGLCKYEMGWSDARVFQEANLEHVRLSQVSALRRRLRGNLWTEPKPLEIVAAPVAALPLPEDRLATLEQHVAKLTDAFDQIVQAYEARKPKGRIVDLPKADVKVTSYLPERNYGFCEAADGQTMFLHGSRLTKAGIPTVVPGDILTVAHEESDRGLRVACIFRREIAADAQLAL